MCEAVEIHAKWVGGGEAGVRRGSRGKKGKQGEEGEEGGGVGEEREREWEKKGE